MKEDAIQGKIRILSISDVKRIVDNVKLNMYEMVRKKCFQRIFCMMRYIKISRSSWPSLYIEWKMQFNKKKKKKKNLGLDLFVKLRINSHFTCTETLRAELSNFKKKNPSYLLSTKKKLKIDHCSLL